MAKITKTLAEHVSRKLTEKLEEKRQKDETALADYLAHKKLNCTPEEVLKFSEGFPGYLTMSNGFRASCGGLHTYKTLTASISVPVKTGSSNYIELTEAEYAWFVQQSAEIAELGEKRHVLRVKIEATLLALSTPKRIAEQFPQSLPFLPADFLDNKSTVPAVQMGDLLAELDQIKTL